MQNGSDGILYLSEDDRYGRLRLIPWWSQDKVRSARVMVVGAGALGNEVLKNLALLGVGDILVVDHDTVEVSNLSRSILFRAEDRGRSKAECAAAAVRALNPDVEITALHGDVRTDVGVGTFPEMDVVIGCLDNREARLWLNRQCWKASVPWVDGAIQELGGVCQIFLPPDSSCYECAVTEADHRLLRLRQSCPLLREEDLMQGRIPTVPTTASIIAGLQVQEALKILHGLPVEGGCALVFHGDTNQFYSTRLPRRQDCPGHVTWPKAERLELSAADTARTLFQADGRSGASLLLERELLVSLQCEGCETSHSVLWPVFRVPRREGLCPTCGVERKARIIDRIPDDSEWADLPLLALGVAPYDVVRVEKDGEVRHHLLLADRESVIISG